MKDQKEDKAPIDETNADPATKKEGMDKETIKKEEAIAAQKSRMPDRNSAVIQQRDQDGDFPGGRKGKK